MVVWITTTKMNDSFDQNSECKSCTPIQGIQGDTQRAIVRGLTAENDSPPNGPIADDGATYNINIESLDYGFIVRVGCQTIAIETKKKLIDKLTAYIKDPVGFQKNGTLLLVKKH